LIDDYRPSLDSGLFIGYQNGEIDEEVCGFDEFEEIEIEEMDTELDKAFDFQDNYWKGLERRVIGLKILPNTYYTYYSQAKSNLFRMNTFQIRD